MSNITDKMLGRYVYLHLEPVNAMYPVTIHVKLDDEGVAVDAFAATGATEDECVGTTWKTYKEMGVEVREIEDEGL
jgi:hypothetical protein